MQKSEMTKYRGQGYKATKTPKLRLEKTRMGLQDLRRATMEETRAARPR